MAIITRIYGLIDPRDGQIFYIGHTKQLLWIRLMQHVSESKVAKTPNPKHKLIQEILKANSRPKIQEIAQLEDADRTEIKNTEQAWIDFFSVTRQLTNSQPATEPRLGIGVPEKVKPLLGTMRDTELAKKLSVSSGTVTIWRNMQGIPPYDSIHGRYHKIVPPDWAIAIFGQRPDSEIARMLNVDNSTVQKWRDQRSIPSFESHYGRSIKIPCPSEVVPMLGVISDSEIARRSGVCIQTVTRWRKERGIPTFFKSSTIPDWVRPLLGNISDRKLCEKAGVSDKIVRKWRESLKIEAYETRHGKHNRIEIPDWAVPLLGTMFDRELGAMVGVDKKVVARWRREKGILDFESVYGRPNGYKKRRE